MKSASDFRFRIAPVYFRRVKEDVLNELPEKIEVVEWCCMTDEERDKYVWNLKQKDFALLRQNSWLLEDINKSSKAQRLLDIIEESIMNGKKVIVFSFFHYTMNKIEQMISKQVKVYGPIDGSVSPNKRQVIIDEFTKCDNGAVLLSQILAGGTGLNIQAASVIIICEPQLKPSIENQAIARSYRMGQIDTVMVYRLLCERTVDERIYRMLQNKQEIFDAFADKSVSGDYSLDNKAIIANLIEDEIKAYNING